MTAAPLAATRSAEGLDRDTWTRTRHAAAVDVLRARGVSAPLAWTVASALLGHWAIECGWGRSEWRFNVGNVKPGSAWRGAVQVLPDGLTYRAYDTLEQGVADAIDLAAGTGSNPAYAPAWQHLLTTGDGVGWYDRLMRAGWHPWSDAALSTYRSTWSRITAVVGPAPAAGTGWGGVALGMVAAALGYALARHTRR
jgi:hypothetical protein